MEHYQQQLDGKYKLVDTEFPLYGELDTTVNATAKTYENYKTNTEESTMTGSVIMPEVSGDGVQILTLKVYYDLVQKPEISAKVTFKVRNGAWNDGKTENVVVSLSAYEDEKLQLTAESIPAAGGRPASGYKAGRWDKVPVASELSNGDNLVYTYTYDKAESSGGGGGGGGGGSTVVKYTLTYVSNGGTKYESEKYSAGETVVLGKTPVREGYTFTGWHSDSGLTDKITKVVMTSDKTVYAGWENIYSPEPKPEPEPVVTPTPTPIALNDKDHYAYIVGYDDGTVQPEGNITRAEVASIFFRLLTDEARNANLAYSNNFSDVREGKWFNVAISTMSKMGILSGYKDGTFRPNESITRAEFAAIAARFDNSPGSGDVAFGDLEGHWAAVEISKAARNGWISGYPDGTFKPDRKITRAEAVSLVNRVLNRHPEEKGDLLEGMVMWPDNMNINKWYYMDIQEATNDHYYENKANGKEKWTEIRPPRNWAIY